MPTKEARSTPVDENEYLLPEFCAKRTLILGCGNILFGDDGFGPAVIEHLLSHYDIPEDIYVMDVGTGVRKLLFTLALSPGNTQRIILIDSVDKGRKPGEIFELLFKDLPLEKADDLFLHLAPSYNLAKELSDTEIDIRILACQVGTIPETVRPGLSDAVKEAVPRMCSHITKEFLAGVSK